MQLGVLISSASWYLRMVLFDLEACWCMLLLLFQLSLRSLSCPMLVDSDEEEDEESGTEHYIKLCVSPHDDTAVLPWHSCGIMKLFENIEKEM